MILAISQNLIKLDQFYAVFNAGSENRSFVILAWTVRELLRFLNDAAGLFYGFLAPNQLFYIQSNQNLDFRNQHASLF